MLITVLYQMWSWALPATVGAWYHEWATVAFLVSGMDSEEVVLELWL